ncbi:Shr3 amino acid permease chaperone [Scleroderma yunnanense]
MGVRAAIVVCATSFLLGCLFTHWIADSLTLWKSPVTDEHLWTAARYYSVLTRGQGEFLYVVYTVILLGGATIFWSLSDGEAGNLMFDGGSIVLYFTTVIMYPYSVIPNVVAKFSQLPHNTASEPFPHALRSPTLELASNHLVCSVALTGVLILQAGRWWAEVSDADDDDPAYLQENASEGIRTPAEDLVSTRSAPIPPS